MATWSNVLLGVCDAPCGDLLLSPYENKIGGYPDFYPTSSLSSPPRCAGCSGPLQLLVQVYCPLEGSDHHRLLHVYCCALPQCCQGNEGWLVLRSQLEDPSYATANAVSTTTTTVSTGSDSQSLLPSEAATPTINDVGEWCVGADDWGEENEVEKRDKEGVLGKQGGSEEEGAKSQEWQQGYSVGDCECEGAGLKNTKVLKTTETDSNREEQGHQKELETQCDVQCLTQKVDSLTVSSAQKEIESEIESECTPLSFQGPHFGSFYLNVTGELLSEERSSQQVEKLLQKYQRDNQENWGGWGGLDDEGEATKEKRKPSRPSHGSGSKTRSTDSRSEAGGGEVYEKAVAKHGDKTFQKFKKVLSRCPNQVLRYNWKGEPLLITDNQRTPQHGEITCKSCGAPVVFEFQLMPPLVYILQANLSKKSETTTRSVEFGTVLVYCCSVSCWDSKEGGVREETVFVQADPDDATLSKTALVCV